MSNDLAKPEGLSKTGEKAYLAIAEFLRSHDMTNTGGCKAFYSPQEWKDRGEEYGTNAELIVVHDGGDLSYIFNSLKGGHELFDKMEEALKRVGLWFETCTCWYVAVYPIEER